MPTYRVTGPDGKVYRVTPPAGTNPTQDEVLARVRSEVERGTPAAAPSGPEDTPSFLRRLGQGYETGAQWLTKKLAKGIETAADTGLSPVSLGPFSEKVAETVVPQTPLQAGVMLGTAAAGPALSGAAKLAPAAGKAVAPWLARILGGTAGGAAGGAVGEEGALRGAAVGAGTSLAGEAGGAFLSKVLRSVRGAKERIAAAEAARVGAAMERAAPTLQPGRTAAAMEATAEGGGLARIGAAKESVIAEIEQALQAVPGQVSQNVAGRPAMVRGATPGQWVPVRQQGEIAVPALGEPSITLRDANARLSEIGDMMRGIKPLDPRFPKDVDLRQLYGAVADDITQGIEAVAGPTVAGQWTRAQAQYRAGRGLLDEILSRSPLSKQGQFNIQDIQRTLRTPAKRAQIAKDLGGNLGTGAGTGPYRALEDVVTRGAGAGMVDRVAGEAPGLLSGRGSYGMWRVPAEAMRFLFPNAPARYVAAPGRQPFAAPRSLQTLLDLALERGALADR